MDVPFSNKFLMPCCIGCSVHYDYDNFCMENWKWAHFAPKHWCIDRECFENTRPDPHTPSMQRTDDVAGLLAKRIWKHTSRPAYTINGAFPQIHDDHKTNTQIQPKKWRNMTKKLKSCCQKWDSNPRPQKWTATWTQRLRPLGHPDQIWTYYYSIMSLSPPYLSEKSCS